MATWNTRSIAGKEHELVETLEKLDLHLLVISETKKKGQGEIVLDGGHIMIYSGVPKEQRAAAGIACIINNKITKKITKWEGYSERILKIEIAEQPNELYTIIAVYGPDENEKSDIKDIFWQNLDMITEKSKGKLFILGDLNARVGRTKSTVIGEHGENVVNNNGRRLLDFCVMNNLIIGNTFFEHKDIHKYTRVGPNGEKSIIDYVIVSKENRKLLNDVRVKRGPEIYSDHFLVESKIKAFSEENPTKTNARTNIIGHTSIKTYRLKEEQIANKYQDAVAELIEIAKIRETQDVETVWQQFKDIITKAAQKTCGVMKKKGNNRQTAWWNEEIKAEVKEKKKLWLAYLNNKNATTYKEYKQQRLKVKILVKEEKEKTWETFGKNMETNSKENQKLFYKVLKTLRQDKTSTTMTVKDKDGGILTEGKDIMNRWKEHFSELLRETSSTNQDKEKEEVENMKINEDIVITEKIEISELIDAIKEMKTGKAAGHDGITTEMLKHLGLEGGKLLLEVINTAWITSKVPVDWNIGRIVPIHKKGDTRNCNNYRGITLLSSVVKVYERILEKRLRREMEHTLSETQSGFRKGRSVQDHIFTLKQIIEKTLLSRSTACLAFIDLEKAFDRVPRKEIWNILAKNKICPNLLNAIRSLYNNNENYVISRNLKSDNFKSKEGLRQGGVLSPVLFLIFMDEIMKKCQPNIRKLQVGYRKLHPVFISECAFADDLVIFANNETNLMHNLKIWKNNLEQYKMKINLVKTKVMVIGNSEMPMNIILDNERIEQVRQFKYLGVTIDQNGKQDFDITERLEKTSKTYYALRSGFIWKKEISMKTKTTIFKTIYRPILTFGCETWVLNASNKSRVQAHEMKFLRGVKGVTRLDGCRNQDIREELGLKSITEFIEERQLAWWGHMKRMNNDRPVKKVWETKVINRRGRGRPRDSWDKIVNQTIVRKGKTVAEANLIARNKKEWAKFVYN